MRGSRNCCVCVVVGGGVQAQLTEKNLRQRFCQLSTYFTVLQRGYFKESHSLLRFQRGPGGPTFPRGGGPNANFYRSL